MSISEPFIRRPIATALLMAALFVGGIIGYNLLPVAALPNVDFPTISVTTSLPGASPEIMASSVAQPLERQFASLPGISQITSYNIEGSSVITLQFALSRDIDGAAGDVQAAINAASGVLPKELPNPPTYKKVNPAEKPVFILGLTSNVMSLPELDQYADLNLAQRVSMLPGIAQVVIFGEQKYAPTVQLNPTEMAARSIGIDDVATAITNNTPRRAGRRVAGLGAGLSDRRQRAVVADRPVEPRHRRVPQRRAGAHQRHRPGRRWVRCPAAARLGQQPYR
jgi:multidrug efflux pump subunit AcrB